MRNLRCACSRCGLSPLLFNTGLDQAAIDPPLWPVTLMPLMLLLAFNRSFPSLTRTKTRLVYMRRAKLPCLGAEVASAGQFI